MADEEPQELIYNENTLYVRIGNISDDNIRATICGYIETAERVLEDRTGLKNTRCDILFNIPRNKNDERLGHGYCWVSRKEIHSLILEKVDEETHLIERDEVDRQILDVTPGCIYPVNPHMCGNVLFASKIPKWVSSEMIEASFRPFAVTQGCSKVAYPLIKSVMTKDNVRKVFITFAKNSNDAAFALQFMKKFEYAHRHQKYTAFFGHAYERE